MKEKMTHSPHDVGVAARIGKYGDAIEVAPNQRWLFTSGTPGMDENGEFPPDITMQAELAWGHVLKMLKSADLSVADLVKITQYLTRAEDIPA
jgi:2-iminobutanoate/2-iminopropanoate deaminase